MSTHLYRNRESLIKEELTRLEALRLFAEKGFYYEDEKNLSKKPEAKKWSALECIEHINLVNERYLKNIDRALQASKPHESGELKWGVFGGLLYKSMLVKDGGLPKLKLESPKGYIPPPNRRAQAVFQDFNDLSQKWQLALDRAGSYSMQLKVYSLQPPIKVFLGTAFCIMSVHSERHLLQAKRALGA